jgi:hypothetical protein
VQTIRRFLVASIVAIALVGVLGSTAFASPMATKSATTTPAGKCVVHDIYLHGNGPATISCAVYATSSSGGVSPNIYEDHCNSYNARLEIIGKYSGSFCFYGTGYLGFGDPGGLGTITSVNTVKSLEYFDGIRFVCGSGWVMYYLPGVVGRKFYFGNCTTYNGSNSVFNGDPWITQAYLN